MLREEFDRDHLVVARGLARLHRALKASGFVAVRSIGSRLDAEAGAHVRFEEEVVYPKLVTTLGQAGVDRLLEQHRHGRDLLATIAEADDLTELRSQLLEDVRLAVEHLTACGSLFHAVEEQLSEQPENLQRLMADRDLSLSWGKACQ